MKLYGDQIDSLKQSRSAEGEALQDALEQQFYEKRAKTPIGIHEMTLRDYFAGQALTNLIPSEAPKITAKYAYAMADAMLEARKEEKKS